MVDKVPEIISTRSGSMIPLVECVLDRGTMVRSATAVPEENDDPEISVNKSGMHKQTIQIFT